MKLLQSLRDLIKALRLVNECNRRAVQVWGCRTYEDAKNHPMVRRDRIEALRLILGHEPSEAEIEKYFKMKRGQ